jgi:TPR repeat protein
MKTFLVGVVTFLVVNSFSQTNIPVIAVKQFRAAASCKVNLGLAENPRTHTGIVLAVYSNRFMFEIDEPTHPSVDRMDIIVQNYPHMEELAVDQRITLLMQKVGTIQGLNEDGTLAVGEVLELWDFYAPPIPTSEQIAAAQAAQDKTKADSKARAIAQKKLGDGRGERYRDGDGVEKDLTKARDCLQKASAAGSPTAKDELFKLSAP